MRANKLKKHDLVGVCAPSGALKKTSKDELKTSEKYLNKYGLKIKYSKNIFANTCGYSATVEEKVEDINNLINDKKVKAISFAKGGCNSNSILDYIDYDGIKDNPKIFFGFSDNTVLLNAISKKANLVTYHFNNYKGLFEGNTIFNRHQFEKAFLEGYSGKVLHNSEWKTIKNGIAKGKLYGGNLGSFVKILNTNYCPSLKNNILFIEDLSCEVSIEQLSSLLYFLKMNKVFDNISGLLIGYYDSKDNVEIEDVVKEVTKEYDFPIIKCNDFGHTSTNIVLPIGIKCTLDADNCELILEEKTVI